MDALHVGERGAQEHEVGIVDGRLLESLRAGGRFDDPIVVLREDRTELFTETTIGFDQEDDRSNGARCVVEIRIARLRLVTLALQVQGTPPCGPAPPVRFQKA
jgi:hypothetical protein